MKATSSSHHRVEPLESRIAPANTIFIGAPDGTLFDTPKDTEYIEGNPTPEFQTKFFVDASTSADPISAALGVPANVPGVSNTYFIRLDAGDEVQGFTDAQSYGSLVRVNKGQAIAFFVDYDHDNDYDPGEFSGLSLGADTDVTVGAKINGDIVTNLNQNGTKTPDDDTLDMSGLVSAKQGIARLEVLAGSVFGSIYSGGDIKSLFVVNNVEKVLAGQAASGATFDFFGPEATGLPNPVGGAGTLVVNTPAKQQGASISNALIGSLGLDPLAPGVYESKTGHLEAGAGGFGAKGGSLTNVQILKDADGFQLYAGDGGAANAGLGISNGGKGGDATNIYVSGVSDNSPNSPQATTPIQPIIGLQPGIVIQAGHGGDGTNSGKGGDGGKATNVFVGFELSGSTRISSGNLLSDNLLVGGGDGGTGKTGGAGGGITNALVRLQTPDVNGDEIALIAGNGGTSVDAKGKAGAGGSISGVDVRNQVSTFNADVALRAGDGGNTVGGGAGAAGGSILKATVLSFDMQVVAGNGSDGKSGGNGGAIQNLTIADGSSGAGEIVAHNVLLNAGKGGNASNGKAGNGGEINTVAGAKTDIQVFLVNTGIQGDGGSSVGGKGGKGGLLNALNVVDSDSGFDFVGNFNVRSGSGGEGTKGGGDAGTIQKVVISGINSNLTLAGGLGGNATLGGKGGAGAAVLKSEIGLSGQVLGVDVFGVLASGAGGTGKGKGGSGGAGGNVQFTNLNADGNVTILGGDGGSGEDALGGGAAGRGGSILVAGGFAKNGFGEMHAGDAGVGGAKPGLGGSVIGNGQTSVSGLLAKTTVAITAGDGSNGGAGGDIKNIGFGSTFSTLSPTPSGNILVKAGAGSAEGKVAGKGGSLEGVFGSVSSGIGTTTQFIAGAGGAANFALGQATLVPGNGATSEVQTIDLTPLATAPAGTFTLGLTTGLVTSATNPLSFASTAAEIDAALEGIGSVAALLGPVGDKVTVVKSLDGRTVTVTFNGLQDVNPLAGLALVGAKGGDGGSVKNISVSTGGAKDAVLTIAAGDAGDANTAGKGAKGGDVRGVGVIAIDPLTIFRSIAAGNGGDAFKTGGLGGTIDQVSVQNHDIGLRSGAVYGFDTMGGLFVGTGGKVPVGGKVGLAGNATNINADAIASIVAGREAAPEFAEKVENIYLNGNQQLVQRDNAFGENGPFKLKFGVDETPLIPKNSQPSFVQQQLNALASITGAGGVTVVAGPIVNGAPTYRVSWNTPGDRAPIIATEDQGTDVSETTKGAIIPFSATELLAGASVLGVTESTPGQRILAIDETVRGDTPVLATEITPGDALTNEQQQLNLFQISPFPGGLIQLSFGGEKAAVLLPQNATGAQVDAVLETLLTIQAVDAGLPGAFPGDVVTVTQSAPFFFQIEFNVPQDVSDLVVADLIIPETQRLNTGGLAAFPTGKFELSFKNQTPGLESETQTTALLNATATNVDIQNALNLLTAVQDAGGVTVTNGPGGTFNIQFGNNGDQRLLVGRGFVPEVQTLNVGTLPATGLLQFGFGGEFTSLPATATAGDIQTALNLLNSVKATGPANTGAVVVAAAGVNAFSVSFNTIGDKLPISLVGFQHEQQTLDLGATGAAPTGEFFLSVKQNVPVFEGLKGVQTSFLVTDLIQGANGFVAVTTPTQGTGTTQETQSIDITGVAGIVGGEFLLTFQGFTTGFIPNSATFADIDTALEGLPGIGAGGVIVTQGANQFLFDVTFTTNGNKPDITAIGGAREFQNLDIDLLANDGTGEFAISFLGQTTDLLPSNATPLDVQNALNALTFVQASGFVTVTAGPGTTHSFDIQFQQFGDVARFTAVGGGDTSHESQLIDLSKIVGVANTTYSLAFGNAATTGLTGASTAADIQNALNGLVSIQNTHPDGVSGSVAVTETAPGSGKFNVVFDIYGDQPSIFGSGQLGTGQTIRLPHDATPAQIQAALNNMVSLTNVVVTANAIPGTFNVDFADNADQPVITATGFIHEVQKVDVFVTGDFVLRFGGNTTGILPANATAADVKAALQLLPSIQNLTPNVDDVQVTAGANSSFDVVLLGDGDLNPIAGTQTGFMEVTTPRNGTALLTEIQQIAYPTRGNFSSAAFSVANIVGAISDFNELGANIFKWTEVNGTPGFNLGDRPIDGLVMAKFFDQTTVNFTPEAKLTANGFFDNENRI